jgi:hypothetical protein
MGSITEDTEDTKKMMGWSFEIHPPAKVLVDGEDGLIECETDLFIQLNTGFRTKHLRLLKGARLAVFLSIALHIDDESVSFPSAETISEETGYSIREVLRSVKELEKLKIIKVSREHRKSNRYKVLQMARFGRLSDKKSVKEVTQDAPKVTQKAKNLRQKSPQEDSLIKNNQLEEESASKNDALPPVKKIGSGELYKIATALSEVCKMDLNANKAQLFREAKLLMAAALRPTPELIRDNYNGHGYWTERDWRGKQGARPTPAQIRQTWGGWMNDDQQSIPSKSYPRL